MNFSTTDSTKNPRLSVSYKQSHSTTLTCHYQLRNVYTSFICLTPIKKALRIGYLQISKSVPDTDLLKGNAMLLSEASKEGFYSFTLLHSVQSKKKGVANFQLILMSILSIKRAQPDDHSRSLSPIIDRPL